MYYPGGLCMVCMWYRVLVWWWRGGALLGGSTWWLDCAHQLVLLCVYVPQRRWRWLGRECDAGMSGLYRVAVVQHVCLCVPTLGMRT
jgi:hypothetical protein